MTEQPFSYIDLATLKACDAFAGTEETRCYLCGVFVTFAPESTTYVATNGHVFIARREFPAKAGTPPNSLLASFIIPSATIKQVKARRATPCQAIVTHLEDGDLIFTSPPNRYVCTPVDGTFPDWKRLIPKVRDDKDIKTESGVAQFDGNDLALFTKFSTFLGTGTPHLHHDYSEKHAVPVSFHNDPHTLGLAMALRAERAEYTPPPWMIA